MKLIRIASWDVTEINIQDPCNGTPAEQTLILFTVGYKEIGIEGQSHCITFDQQGQVAELPSHLDPTKLRELASLIEQTIVWFRDLTALVTEREFTLPLDWILPDHE
jgi:hypothetical protein